MPNPQNIIPPKKGEVRNPNGKPKGTLNRRTIVKRWLEVKEQFNNPLTGENEILSEADIMTISLIKRAKEGDVSAFKELMDSAFGKVSDKIESQQLDENGNPINPNKHTVTYITKKTKS